MTSYNNELNYPQGKLHVSRNFTFFEFCNLNLIQIFKSGVLGPSEGRRHERHPGRRKPRPLDHRELHLHPRVEVLIILQVSSSTERFTR